MRKITVVDVKSKVLAVQDNKRIVKIHEFDSPHPLVLNEKDFYNTNAVLENKVYTYIPVRFKLSQNSHVEEIYFCEEKWKEDSDWIKIIINSLHDELKFLLANSQKRNKKLESENLQWESTNESLVNEINSLWKNRIKNFFKNFLKEKK